MRAHPQHLSQALPRRRNRAPHLPQCVLVLVGLNVVYAHEQHPHHDRAQGDAQDLTEEGAALSAVVHVRGLQVG